MLVKRLAGEVDFAAPVNGAWPVPLLVSEQRIRPTGATQDEYAAADDLKQCAETHANQVLRDAVCLGHPSSGDVAHPDHGQDVFGDVESIKFENNKLMAYLRYQEGKIPPVVAQRMASGKKVPVSVGVMIGGQLDDGRWEGPININHVALLPEGGQAVPDALVPRAAKEDQNVADKTTTELDELKAKLAEAEKALEEANEAKEEKPEGRVLTEDEYTEFTALREETKTRMAKERDELVAKLLKTDQFGDDDKADLEGRDIDTLRLLAKAAVPAKKPQDMGQAYNPFVRQASSDLTAAPTTMDSMLKGDN